MTQVQKKDFVEIEYTGVIKENEVVFDTTDENKAKEADIHDPRTVYGPVVIVVGENHVLQGLDDELAGKETGQEYEVNIPAEKAFGKKDASMLKLIPMKAFRNQQVRPVPGLQVNFDGVPGTVKTVTGGRVIVDFNHPLSGKEVVYKVKINRKVEDVNEKLSSLLELMLNIDKKDMQISIDENNKAKVTINKPAGAINEEAKKKIKDKVLGLIELEDLEITLEESGNQ